jgi:hypothetical protein
MSYDDDGILILIEKKRRGKIAQKPINYLFIYIIITIKSCTYCHRVIKFYFKFRKFIYN